MPNIECFSREILKRVGMKLEEDGRGVPLMLVAPSANFPSVPHKR